LIVDGEVSDTRLVEMLTRHTDPAKNLVGQVIGKNADLQIDSSSLLLDRQGVLSVVPSRLAEEQSVARRFDTASAMIEVIAAVVRLSELGLLSALGEEERHAIEVLVATPEVRFRHSTTSLMIWRLLAKEFHFSPQLIANWAGPGPVANRSATANLKRVLSLHGIRTRGKWQKDVSHLLSSEGLAYAPLDYGFFGAIQLLIPTLRSRRVEWFRNEYTRVMGASASVPPHVIAHSFGTYIVAKALSKYPEICVDRVIFCGSIVPEEFPWAAIVKRDQLSSLLNLCGGRDIWVKICQWVVLDAGASGVTGFSESLPGKVENCVNPEFGHSDYFYDLQFAQSWLPYLLRGKVPNSSELQKKGTNWRFVATMIAIAIAVFVAIVAI